MTRLTLFTKILIGIAATALFIGCISMCVQCTSCSDPQQTYHQPQSPVTDYGDYQVVNNPNGQQVVVVKNNDGSEFFMNYLMWQTIFNSQGMSGVHGYYNQHRSDPDWGYQQSTYRSTTKTVINNYYGATGGQKIDDSKPIGEQIKYNQSNGFGKKETPVVPNTGKKSDGFSGKWFESSEKTSTPDPVYNKSNGFGSGSTNTTSKPSYSPSSGVGSTKSSTYTPSSGFGTKSPTSTYKPSSGFGSGSSSSSGYKSSSGFGSSSRSSTTPTRSSSPSRSSGFGKKQ